MTFSDLICHLFDIKIVVFNRKTPLILRKIELSSSGQETFASVGKIIGVVLET